MTSTQTRLSIAGAAAMLALAMAPSTAYAKGGDVAPCYGVNTCKGTSDCKSAHNECKGQNACKGQGFKDLTAKQCAAAGGSQTPKS